MKKLALLFCLTSAICTQAFAAMNVVKDEDLRRFRHAINQALTEMSAVPNTTCFNIGESPQSAPLSPSDSFQQILLPTYILNGVTIFVNDANTQPALQLMLERGNEASNNYSKTIVHIATDSTGTKILQLQIEKWASKLIEEKDLRNPKQYYRVDLESNIRCQIPVSPAQ